MGCDAEYVDDVHDEFECSVCLLPMLRAAVVTPCGHSFCEGCLVVPHTGVALQECPTCRGAIGSTAPSYTVRNVMNGLFVYCSHEARGCKERMSRDALDHHAATCGFGEVTCTHAGCGATVLRRDLKAHVAKCEWRVVTCPKRCGERVPRGKLEKHKAEECVKRMVECEKCGTKRKAEASEEHRKRHCPDREVECEVAGCGVMYKRGAQAEHMKEHGERHVELLAAENKALRSCVCELESRQKCQKWIVDGFSAKRQAKQRVRSGEMVMSHEHVAHRYPFQLEMDSKGMNNGGAVGLYFVPRRGEHPHRLEWPMKKRVELRIVNQKGGNDIVGMLDPVNNEGDKAFFSKHAPPAAGNTPWWWMPFLQPTQPGPQVPSLGYGTFLEPSEVDDYQTSTDCMEVEVRLFD